MAVNFTDLNGLIGFPTLCLPPFHSYLGVPVCIFSMTPFRPCEPKSVVKQLTAFCVVYFHMKRPAALGSTVWAASSGAGLCQPFLRMHSLRLPPKTRRHWWKKQHLSHGPRGTGQRCFGGLASGWQVPLVFLKAKRDGRMEEDGTLFGFLSRRKLYCIPPFCYPSPSGLLVCWHFQLWGCSPASLAIVPLCSHSGV